MRFSQLQPRIPVHIPKPGLATGRWPDFSRSEVSRIHSRERDFGLHWRQDGTVYRAAWIEATDELYIVQLGTPSDGGGHLELLAVASPEQLEQALAGWRDIVGQPNSPNWLLNQTRHLRSSAPV